MPMENRLDPTPYSTTPTTTNVRSISTYIISVLVALLIGANLLIGYLYLQRRNAQRASVQSTTKAIANPPALQPSVQIIENDAMLKGSQAVVSGIVVNISTAPLSNLNLEFELRRRKDGALESRVATITPGQIEPNQQGKYSLVVPRDYSSAKIKRLASNSIDLGFKTAPGLPRPPEPPPQTVKTIIVKRPPNKNAGGDFINTPDTPAKVP